MLKIVPDVDFCGGCETETLYKRYYEVKNTTQYEYHPTFTNLTEAIDYIYSQGQTEIIIDMKDWVFGPFTRTE